MSNSQVTTTHEFHPRKNSIWEYLSPFGVISTKEFIYRLLCFLAITILSIIVLVIIIPITLEYLKQENYAVLVLILMSTVFIYAFLLIWFLISTLTKDYRTNGTPIPFIFALATPFVPLILLIKYILSSKLEKEVNKAWAEIQKQVRENHKENTEKHVNKHKVLDRD